MSGEFPGAFDRAFEVARHHRLGHGDSELVHDGVEKIAIFRVVDRIYGRAENPATGFLQAARDVERGLAAELHDDALGLLRLVDLQHVLERDRLEVELV